MGYYIGYFIVCAIGYFIVYFINVFLNVLYHKPCKNYYITILKIIAYEQFVVCNLHKNVIHFFYSQKLQNLKYLLEHKTFASFPSTKFGHYF